MLAIFLGGGLGSLMRFGVEVVFSGTKFPWGTFVSNAIACVLLGVFVGWFAQGGHELSRTKLFLITGVCGGFSTFSTFSYESFKLWQEGEHLACISNIGGSIFVCLLCILLGIKIVSIFI